MPASGRLPKAPPASVSCGARPPPASQFAMPLNHPAADVVGWEQDGALHGAVVWFNLTTAKPMDEARATCRAVQASLPSKLGSGATVQTTTFSYTFDPSAAEKKGESGTGQWRAGPGGSCVAPPRTQPGTGCCSPSPCRHTMPPRAGFCDWLCNRFCRISGCRKKCTTFGRTCRPPTLCTLPGALPAWLCMYF